MEYRIDKTPRRTMNNNRSTLQESVLVAVTNLMDDMDAIESLITDETNVAMRDRIMIIKRSRSPETSVLTSP